MTPLPKRRHSSQRSGKRQAARWKALKKIVLVKCANCGKLKKPHQVCSFCGQYDNRIILPEKKEKKKS